MPGTAAVAAVVGSPVLGGRLHIAPVGAGHMAGLGRRTGHMERPHWGELHRRELHRRFG